ncbi:MAG: hypothetical protein U2P89_01970 [Proteiniphilum sp.]|uniref:hypothetical protein n=1 Tax=Proteiniphilum sp. TaxID=1926877 RepID=UPI002ABC0989|nr:hypothetical protein [Proteiniphilum sp.]MDY9917622.1 hypothetical protein [Proteiniphilum sp.]
MVVSAPVDADLLDADSWLKTNYLPFDPTYLNANFLTFHRIDDFICYLPKNQSFI